MSETKWTSGPYKPKFIRGEGTSWWVVTDLAGYEIAEVSYTAGSAEAHLFAAASDLYDALEAFVNNSSVQVNQPYECERAEAALAKARGEER